MSESPHHLLLGTQWTLIEVRDFVSHCYDRDALLMTLLNYGAEWFHGRLICVVSNSFVQPFMARGWGVWGDDRETTAEMSRIKLPIGAQGVLATIISEGTHTVGSPAQLSFKRLFDETPVAEPQELVLVPLQLAGKSKMLFVGESRIESSNLREFSEALQPMLVVAEEVAQQLEVIIKLAKAKKLPPVGERIPTLPTRLSEVHESRHEGELEREMAEALQGSTSDISEPEEQDHHVGHESSSLAQEDPAPSQETIAAPGAEIELAPRHRKTLPLKIDNRATSQNPSLTMAQVQQAAKSELDLGRTQMATPLEYMHEGMVLGERSPAVDVKALPPSPFDSSYEEKSAARPVPFNPEQAEGGEHDEPGVHIIAPIGVVDKREMAKQTIMGGFSMVDLERVKQEFDQEARDPSKARVTLSGLSSMVKIEEQPAALLPAAQIFRRKRKEGEGTPQHHEPAEAPAAHPADAPAPGVSPPHETLMMQAIVKPDAAAPMLEEETQPSEASTADYATLKLQAIEALSPQEDPSEPQQGLPADPEEDAQEDEEPYVSEFATMMMAAIPRDASPLPEHAQPREPEEALEAVGATQMLHAISTPEPVQKPESISQHVSDSWGAMVDDLDALSESLDFESQARELAQDELAQAEPAVTAAADSGLVEPAAEEVSQPVLSEPAVEAEPVVEAPAQLAAEVVTQPAQVEQPAPVEDVEDVEDVEQVEQAPQALKAPEVAAPEVAALSAELERALEAVNGRDFRASFEAAQQLTAHPEVMERLERIFPGRLYVDRYQWTPERFPAPERHGPVIKALFLLGEDSIPLLERMLSHSGLDHRFYATFLLLHIGGDSQLQLLMERLFDRDSQTRTVAARALLERAAMPGYEADVLEPLRREIQTPQDELHAEQAGEFLGRARDVGAIKALIETMDQHDGKVQRTLHAALQTITLQPLPASGVAWRRWYTSASNEPRSTWLLQALNSPSDLIRQRAARELTELEGLELDYRPDQPPRMRARAQQQLKQWLEDHQKL